MSSKKKRRRQGYLICKNKKEQEELRIKRYNKALRSGTLNQIRLLIKLKGNKNED